MNEYNSNIFNLNILKEEFNSMPMIKMHLDEWF